MIATSHLKPKRSLRSTTTCRACNAAGTWRERFDVVLCSRYYLLALLGWLNSQPKMLETRKERMMAKKREIQTHFDRLTVQIIPDTWSGLDIFNIQDLDPDAEYRVLATFLYRFDDDSTEPAFLIEGPEGNISARACKKFRVAELK